MTALVLVLTILGGIVATIYFFFQIGDLGWIPFIGSLVGTAVLSVLSKLWEITEATLNNNIAVANQLNVLAKQISDLQSKRVS